MQGGRGEILLDPADSERLIGLTARLPQLSFDELRDRAAELLATLLPHLTMEVSGQQSDRPPLVKGLCSLPDGRTCYRHYYFGPPEPLWFTVLGVSNDDYTTTILDLYFRRLTAALTMAGHRQELQLQSRRNWLSGFMRQQGFERRLATVEARNQLLGLVAAGGSGPAQDERQKLAVRRFSRQLRAHLSEREQAFHLDNDQIALIIPESERYRFDALLQREMPDALVAWVGLTEARGLEVLKLAEARLLGIPPGVRRRAPEPFRAQEETNPLLGIHSGSESVLQLARSQLGDWRFDRRIQLIFDEPVGYALELLPQLRGDTVIVTSSSSVGYLVDLSACKPAGLLLEPMNLQSLRSNLERVAAGERVYSGPLLEDTLLPRERLVWRLTANGIENQEIAELLGVSVKTVANYLSSLQEKLGYGDRAALALGYWFASAS